MHRSKNRSYYEMIASVWGTGPAKHRLAASSDDAAMQEAALLCARHPDMNYVLRCVTTRIVGRYTRVAAHEPELGGEG